MSDELTRRIDLAIAVIRDAQAFEHEHELTTHHTRRLPRGILRQLTQWQKVTAEQSATLCESQPTAPATGSEADSTGSPSAREESAVAASPIVGVRIPEPLKREAEAYGRERRWSFGEVTRVALERLIGYVHEPSNEPPGHRHDLGATPPAPRL